MVTIISVVKPLNSFHKSSLDNFIQTFVDVASIVGYWKLTKKQKTKAKEKIMLSKVVKKYLKDNKKP